MDPDPSIFIIDLQDANKKLHRLNNDAPNIKKIKKGYVRQKFFYGPRPIHKVRMPSF
jgi:hypothetical protein